MAYSRIPAHQVLYSVYSEEACGQYCGKTQTIFLKVLLYYQNTTAKVILLRISAILYVHDNVCDLSSSAVSNG